MPIVAESCILTDASLFGLANHVFFIVKLLKQNAIQLSIIAAITSFIPNLDFNHPANPPHIAPPKQAIKRVSGTCIIAGNGIAEPTIVATKAPIIN